ncbi:MAG: DUF4142 domain-containing protein [Chryseolinea sp.]
MRNFIIVLNLAVVLLIASFFSNPERQEQAARADEREASMANNGSLVSLKNQPNQATTFPGDVDGSSKRATMEERRTAAFVKDFIYDLSEVRIMDREQGKLAVQRGTSKALKEYGAMMVKDQTRMLSELTKIALSKEASVATILGKKKTEGLSELHKLHGQNFDTKFIRTMIADHKRDIKKLEKATRSKDPHVQVFATKYLPLVKSHLAKLLAIDDGK